MTQNEFFNIIMDELKELPELELQEIISFYKSKICSEVLNGKNEEEIIKDFGDPYLICLNYKNNSSNTKFSKKDCISSNINLKKKASDDVHNNIHISNINYIDPINVIPNNNNTDNHTNKRNINNDYNKSSPHVDKFLKICIIILGLIIFFPLLTSIIGIIFGILGAALGLFAGSIGILIGGTFTSIIGMPNIPQFIADFPYPVIVLFTLGSICLSILLILVSYYSCKFFFRLCKKIFDFFRSKGGIFNE